MEKVWPLHCTSISDCRPVLICNFKCIWLVWHPFLHSYCIFFALQLSFFPHFIRKIWVAVCASLSFALAAAVGLSSFLLCSCFYHGEGAVQSMPQQEKPSCDGSKRFEHASPSNRRMQHCSFLLSSLMEPLTGVINSAIGQIMYLYGLQLTTATNAATLSLAIPIW